MISCSGANFADTWIEKEDDFFASFQLFQSSFHSRLLMMYLFVLDVEYVNLPSYATNPTQEYA
jgi:hypothetical protein